MIIVQIGGGAARAGEEEKGLVGRSDKFRRSDDGVCSAARGMICQYAASAQNCQVRVFAEHLGRLVWALNHQRLCPIVCIPGHPYIRRES